MADDVTPPRPGGPAAVEGVSEVLARVERESGRPAYSASAEDWMRAVAHACRADLAQRMHETLNHDRNRQVRRVHYLSMEYLMGRALANALSALGLDVAFAQAARRAGKDPREILEREPDAALGNGGLGRLAACFLDSMATLGIPTIGYGLRYRYGMFAQRMHEGMQTEEADDWLRHGTPWELQRSEICHTVGFGGRVVEEGTRRRWHPAETLQATAFDHVVPGHETRRIALLRQWKAEPNRPIDFTAFSRGDYHAAGAAKHAAETINWVLYPDDSTPAGRELRLKQEFFLVSASVQDIVAGHLADYGRLDGICDKVAIHLNDTHCALAVPELLRLMIDEHGMGFDQAWQSCARVFSYTNHTLLPEALETWPVPMVAHLLPRHLELIYEINLRLLKRIRQDYPGDEALARRVSLIEEDGERRVRMAALSIVASNHVNGVSKLHSELMTQTIFADYARIFPGRFCNVTNGVTPRRWLAQANPALAAIIDRRIGGGWRTRLERLQALAAHAGDGTLRAEVLAAKRHNKERLADLIRRELGLAVDPASLFDVQVKRFHEYKRQLLNLLHVVARYQAIVDAPQADWTPRTVIFAGKAATAYRRAKEIIRLIHDVARTVNADPRAQDHLRIAFLPNYGVSLAEAIIPAADLSEQISTAGMEASGTGNMKLALNGALTIGTWDGATIEMAQAIGREHFFIFGLTAEQVNAARQAGYDPRRHYEESPQLRRVLDAIAGGEFSPSEPDRYRGLVNDLLGRDTYFLLADFADYAARQADADALFVTPSAWADKAIRNIAPMGWFSSDRAVREYAERIWNVPL